MLRGVWTPWSHLEQRGGDHEVLRGIGTPWSHLQQKGGDHEVLRGLGLTGGTYNKKVSTVRC